METGRHQIHTAVGPTRLAAKADRTKIRADDTDLAYIDLTLVDHRGTVVTGSDEEITIDISGPGVLQGFGSANPVNEHTKFTDTVHRTYDGRALAIVRPTAEGTILLRATTTGGISTQVRIDAGGDKERNGALAPSQPGAIGPRETGERSPKDLEAATQTATLDRMSAGGSPVH